MYMKGDMKTQGKRDHDGRLVDKLTKRPSLPRQFPNPCGEITSILAGLMLPLWLLLSPSGTATGGG